jgi:hypothetical protein
MTLDVLAVFGRPALTPWLEMEEDSQEVDDHIRCDNIARREVLA